MGLPLEEQETHINFSRDGVKATVYTSDTTVMTKLNKLVKLQGTEWKLESESKLKNGELVEKTYSCPVEFISFRSKRTKREYTEEEKKEIVERLHNNRNTF